jgi:hypothetical protein
MLRCHSVFYCRSWLTLYAGDLPLEQERYGFEYQAVHVFSVEFAIGLAFATSDSVEWT